MPPFSWANCLAARCRVLQTSRGEPWRRAEVWLRAAQRPFVCWLVATSEESEAESNSEAAGALAKRRLSLLLPAEREWAETERLRKTKRAEAAACGHVQPAATQTSPLLRQTARQRSIVLRS